MSINDDAMADLFKLPEPDYIHVSKLEEPIGSDRSWKFQAMRKMLHRAEKAERKRDELLSALIDTLDFVERHSNRWDGENGKHPATVVENARQAIANAKGA